MESTNNSGGTFEKLAAAGGLFAGGLGFLDLLGGNNGGGLLGNNRSGGLQGIIDLALLQGLIGGNNNSCGSQKDAIIADLSARLAGSQSEKYADGVGLETYKALLGRIDKLDGEDRANFKEIFQELARIGQEGVRNEERYKCLAKELDYRFEALRRELIGNDRELAHAIETESERRVREDEHIKEYMDCNFVRNKKVIPTDNLCPPVRLADGSVSGQNTINVRLVTDTNTNINTDTADTPAAG